MQANYGYKDGSGEFFITIDTERCNSCGKCVEVCPEKILVMVEDPYDPLSERNVPMVIESQRKKIKYTCGPCKPINVEREEPCINVCEPGAITHSW